MKKIIFLLCLAIALPLFAQQVDLSKIDDSKVGVTFTYDTRFGSFTDTLWYTGAEFSALSRADLRAAKQARRDAWIALQQSLKDNPPPAPTKVQKIEAANNIADNLDRQLDQVLADENLTKAECRTIKDRLQLDIDKLNAAILVLKQ